MNSPSISFAAASSAWSFSKACSACSISVSMSPMPRMRPGHAVGVELLEGVELLARGGEGDRPADDLLDRQRRAAAGVAVELRQDHAVDLRACAWNASATSDGVLAGHRVDDEERVVGLRRRRRSGGPAPSSRRRSTRRPAVSTMTHVAAEARASSRPGRRSATGIAGLGEHRHVDLAAERAQLLDGGGALEVGADQQRVAALRLEPAGELGGVGGLARALQAGHQHDRRRLRRRR